MEKDDGMELKILRDLKKHGTTIEYNPASKSYWLMNINGELVYAIKMLETDMENTYLGTKEYQHKTNCKWHPNNFNYEIYDKYGDIPQCKCFYLWKQPDEKETEDIIDSILDVLKITVKDNSELKWQH